MPHRQDSKIRGGHTTCIELSGRVIDILSRLSCVSGISLGIIITGKSGVGGDSRVKIGDMSGWLIVVVRQPGSIQELRVFTHKNSEAKLAISRALRNNHIPIHFK